MVCKRVRIKFNTPDLLNPFWANSIQYYIKGLQRTNRISEGTPAMTIGTAWRQKPKCPSIIENKMFNLRFIL